MTYSFNVTGTTHAEVKQRVIEEFDRIVQQQPAHAADRDAAQTAAFALVDATSEPTRGPISVAMHGELVQWAPDDPAKRRTTGASMNIVISMP